jgi:PAS domain-containing protein
VAQGGDAAFWVDGIISDISDRKHNEMRIEALLAEQGAVLDNVMFGIVQERDLRVVSTNRRFERAVRLCGRGAGRRVDRGAVPGLGNLRARHRGQRAGPGQRQGVQRRAPVPAPRRQPVHVPGERPRGRPERPHGDSIWVYADVTERRQAEEKLRLSATVLEHIADGVMVIDVHGRIVATNPAYTQITGYTESEALGHPVGPDRREPGQQRRATRRPFTTACGATWRTPASGAARSGARARTARSISSG